MLISLGNRTQVLKIATKPNSFNCVLKTSSAVRMEWVNKFVSSLHFPIHCLLHFYRCCISGLPPHNWYRKCTKEGDASKKKEGRESWAERERDNGFSSVSGYKYCTASRRWMQRLPIAVHPSSRVRSDF